MNVRNISAERPHSCGCAAAFTIAAIVSVLATGQASAHLLDDAMIARLGPFVAGLSHPVLGPDHFLAMFSVGLVSAIMAGHHFWRVPLCFVGGMPAGWMLGRAHMVFPPVEIGISLSVLFLGVAAMWTYRIPTTAIYAAVVVFALFHGYAHGQETPTGWSLEQYVAGFTAGTAGIHVLGLFVGDMLRGKDGQDLAIKSLSVTLMLSGGWFLFAAALAAVN